jgi:hypothetical protein
MVLDVNASAYARPPGVDDRICPSRMPVGGHL